jgi:hypothetical protein
MGCEGGTKGAEVNIHYFFHRASVSACKRPGDWDAVATGEFEDEAIAGFEVGGSEIERGVWVIAEGIGAGLVEEEIGRGGMEKARKILLKKFEKLGTIGFCRQRDGVVIGAIGVVQGGDIAVAEVVAVIVAVDGEGAGPRTMMEEGSGPVAVVKIEIENCACANGASGAKILESDDEPIKSAVAFPVLGGCVMKSTGDGAGDAVGESGAGGREDGTVGEKDGRIELRAPGKLLRFGERTGISSFDSVNIIFGVDSEEILASDWGG